MLTLLLLAIVAATPSAIDAELAFSHEAQRNGQWAAFRSYAGADAVVFTPRATWARDFLKGKERGGEIRWSPNASYVSCDGEMAVNTGPWRDAKSTQAGFFTTVWEHQNGQWKWISHGRHTLYQPLAPRSTPIVRKASCRGRAPGPPLMGPPPIRKGPGATPDDFGRGYSSDRTLGWEWRVGPKGARHFRTYMWTGRGYTLALEQTIGGKWGN